VIPQQHPQNSACASVAVDTADAGSAIESDSDSDGSDSSASSWGQQYSVNEEEDARRVHAYIDNISDICMESDEEALEVICASHGVLFAYDVARLAVRMEAFAADDAIYLAYRRICRERSIDDSNMPRHHDAYRAMDARAATVDLRVAAKRARIAFLVAFSDSVPRFGRGPLWDQWLRVKREPPHDYYQRRQRVVSSYMRLFEQQFERLQPQMREALVAADAEYDALTARQVQQRQQIAALQTQSSIAKAQLRGAKREFHELLALSVCAPSNHVDSAIKEQRNKITELASKQDDTAQADALDADYTRVKKRMLHLRLHRASLKEYTVQKADASK